MQRVGFIGCGHMGGVLLESLLRTEALRPGQVCVSTRTPLRLAALKQRYPDLEIAADNCLVARQASVLFLCVGTSQAYPVLKEIRSALRGDTHLVIISGGLEIGSVARLFDGPITKIMPTLLAGVLAGVTLLCHNNKVSAQQAQTLVRYLSEIGEVRLIQEDQFELAADFTSCTPGLLAAICDQLVRAGARHGSLTQAELSALLLPTLYGTAKLLLEDRESFAALIQRVATRGGATEAGVAVLEAELPEVYEKVLAATLERHTTRKAATRQQFAGPA